MHYLRPKPPEDMKLVKGGHHYDANWTNPDGSPRLDAVRAAWREGYTIIINAMDRRWEPVAHLAASLREQLHHPIDVNLYFTPPGVTSSSAHFDVMDFFVLQLEGSKIWEVRNPFIHLPLPDEQAEIPHDRLPPLAMKEELHEGDVLYLPRGYAHVPRTTSAASLHLTVGVNVVTWIDLFAAAISAARDDNRFRMALPPSFLNGATDMREQFLGLLRDLPAHLDMDGALNRLAEQLIVGTPPPPGDEYPALEVELKIETVLARRRGVICRALEGPGYAVIQYSGGKIIGPEKIGAALRFVTQNCAFSIRDLPDGLSEQEKFVLMRRLIRGGLLEVREAG